MKVKLVPQQHEIIPRQPVYFSYVNAGKVFTTGWYQDGEWYNSGINRYLKLTNRKCVDFQNNCLVEFDDNKSCIVEDDAYVCIPK